MANKKKIVYFLGAGASYGAGATAIVQAGGKIPIPTQATFWNTFLRFCSSRRNRIDIESFLFRYFLGYGKTPARLTPIERRKLLTNIDVEEVFTFLSERARAPSTSPQLRTYALKIWNALVSEIGNVFLHFKPNVKTRSVYRSLMSNHYRSFDTIVSFNYDTIFESSLLARTKARYVGLNDSSGGVSVLKPHGSVNWGVSDDGSIQIESTPAESVIVAPTHLKFVSTNPDEGASQAGYLNQSEEIRDIWAQMEQKMRGARVLIFIGYSFPVSDLYFSSVLRSVLADRDTNPGIVVVNPDAVAISDRLKSRFAIRKVVQYFDIGQFVQSSRAELIDQIIA